MVWLLFLSLSQQCQSIMETQGTDSSEWKSLTGLIPFSMDSRGKGCCCVFSASAEKDTKLIIMATLHSRCGHYIFVLFLLSSTSFFAWSQQSQIACLPYFYTWCGTSANLECRSEMCCMRLARNTGPKNSPSGCHHTTLSGYIFATKTHIDNRKKKLVKHQCLLHMFSQYGELRPNSGWDLLASLWHPSKFQRVSRLGSVTARHSSSGRQPKFAALNIGRIFRLLKRFKCSTCVWLSTKICCFNLYASFLLLLRSK